MYCSATIPLTGKRDQTKIDMTLWELSRFTGIAEGTAPIKERRAEIP